MRSQSERRWTPTTKPYRETKPRIVTFLEEQGYELSGTSQHGNRREMTKGATKLVLHFRNRDFLGAHIHLSPEKNIGRVTENQLKAFFDGGLCLSEFQEEWGQTRFCKGEPHHEGDCFDDYGAFPRSAA